MCKVYTGPWLTKVFRFEVECNLALGRRVQQQFQDFDVPEDQASSLQMGLLLPALTDLRDQFQGGQNDVIEVPSDSGRWYGLECYDDVGKGFSNEYRLAVISKIAEAVDGTAYAGLEWPIPCP
jgi:hypothetical protein